MDGRNSSMGRGRPYRSHLHPACFSCKRRKSRCKTQNSTDRACLMCQAHGTECIFPHPEDGIQRRSLASPRKSPGSRRQRFARDRDIAVDARPSAMSHTDAGTTCTEADPGSSMALLSTPPQMQPSSGDNDGPQNLSNLVGIVAETGDNSSHIVSPSVADDNEILESYLSAASPGRRCLLRTTPSLNQSPRPVRFNIVPRRPLGVTVNQSLAASKCEIIEKYLSPDIEEYIDLFFQKANVCFPIFDEALFKSVYFSHKEKMSSALLCNLYANSLVYRKNSPKLCSSRAPDIRFIWNQANEALHSELFLSPGISTVMSIIINVGGRPSTSIFGNGGMVGTAVAISNALGLNRDPSGWSISPLEKRLRIRIWWIVVIYDCWCSLAYGTPLQIHRSQYDVPFPSVHDICPANASPFQRAGASIFVAFSGLTDVLARYLEDVYSVSKESQSLGVSAIGLETFLHDWEESLSDDVRHIILRGTTLEAPGAANLRLGYLAVKLLLRRIQLSKSGTEVGDDSTSPLHMHVQRAAEDIAHLVEEMDETQLRGFWIPMHAFSVTSAALFLLRSGLRTRQQNRATPLKTAKDLISTLQVHREEFDWDLADNCLSHCSDAVEKIDTNNLQGDVDLSVSEFPDFLGEFEMDSFFLEGLF